MSHACVPQLADEEKRRQLRLRERDRLHERGDVAGALALYEKMGFCRDERLVRYSPSL